MLLFLRGLEVKLGEGRSFVSSAMSGLSGFPVVISKSYSEVVKGVWAKRGEDVIEGMRKVSTSSTDMVIDNVNVESRSSS